MKTLTDIYGPGITVSSRPPFTAPVTGLRDPDAQEWLSAPPVAVAGDTPVICSSGAAFNELRAVLLAQGMPVATELLTYRNQTEYEAAVANTLSSGNRISSEYANPTAINDDNALNPAWLVRYLNNKGNLADLVPTNNLPARRVGNRTELHDAMDPATSWVLKAATDNPNGGGLDVWLHHAGTPLDIPEFADVEPTLVLEEFLDLTHNWSVQLYIDPQGGTHQFGVTEQRIDNGIFAGNRFGNISDVRPELIAASREVARRAADLGYRGICAIDGGATADSRIVIFDTNFRIGAATCPLIFLSAYRSDLLDKVIETARWNTTTPLAEALQTLRPAIEAEHLLVMSAFDPRYTDHDSNRSSLFVAVIGGDRDEVTQRRNNIAAAYNIWG